MEYIDFFKELFVLAFGGFTALVLSFYIVWPKIENYLLRINGINQNREFLKERNQLGFAAYERLILFVHRISPDQVMVRHHDNRLSVSQFKQALIADIEAEFQHNFTQQLYVTDAAWGIVKNLKENTVELLRNGNKGLSDQASTQDYIAVLLTHIKDIDVNPYEAAQVLLKKEMSA